MRGRCLCGSVQYALETSIISCAHCHCESCRRASSAAFVTWTKAPSSQLKVTSGGDRISRYESSPGAYRLFCGTCGSQLFMEYAQESGMVYVTLASLESAPANFPDKHVSYEERIGWLELNDSLPKFHGKSEREIS